MQSSENNPAENKLHAGTTEQALIDAIEASGYPLQSVAIDAILKALKAPRFRVSVQEEWSYLDKDENTVRHIDGLISYMFGGQGKENDRGFPVKPSGYIRQSADFLLECKQSELPYIFFLRPSRSGPIPRIVGMRYPEIEVRLGSNSGPHLPTPLSDILEIPRMEFASEPPTAVSMSKAHWKGKALELSGEESFRGLALPLLKAVQHYLSLGKPPEVRIYFDLRYVFPLAVLRAPMVGVQMHNDQMNIQLLPWVRVVYAEPPDESEAGWFANYSDNKSFDVVHINYLEQYVTRALTTARIASKRVERIAVPIITGQAIQPRKYLEEDLVNEHDLPLWKTLRASLSKPKFEQWYEAKSREMHVDVYG